MKNVVQPVFKQLLTHRYLFILLLAFIVLTLGVVTHILLTLQPSELRVVTHYTAYGATHFYRDQWVYFVGYILFALLTLGLYVVLCVKLLMQDRAPLAIAYAWVGIFIVLFSWLTYVHLVEFL